MANSPFRRPGHPLAAAGGGGGQPTAPPACLDVQVPAIGAGPAVTIEPAPPEPEPAASVPPGDPPVPRERRRRPWRRRRPRWKGRRLQPRQRPRLRSLGPSSPRPRRSSHRPFGPARRDAKWPAGWRNCSGRLGRISAGQHAGAPRALTSWTRPAGTSPSAGRRSREADAIAQAVGQGAGRPFRLISMQGDYTPEDVGRFIDAVRQANRTCSRPPAAAPARASRWSPPPRRSGWTARRSGC